MTVLPEPMRLGPQLTLFDHALQLHREYPDSPLPRDGQPFPDERQHRGQPRPRAPKDRRAEGAEAAAVLDGYFGRPSAVPSELAAAFHDVHVPIHPNDHIAAAACRADAQRVQETGRWLIRHATDRCAVTIGLALLASAWDDDDIPVIQTIGLLSNHFGPLAARALERRRSGEDALLWLADRVSGWGRVYVVESLCKVGGAKARPWLLRRACDGDYLNGYFAGKVATAAHLHEAITRPDADDELVDHTGRLLTEMAGCGGMGMTLGSYPPAAAVLEAHAGHVDRLAPTPQRYFVVAQLADSLHRPTADVELSIGAELRERILGRHLATLSRDNWASVAATALAEGDERMTWLAGGAGNRLALPGLAERDTGS